MKPIDRLPQEIQDKLFFAFEHIKDDYWRREAEENAAQIIFDLLVQYEDEIPDNYEGLVSFNRMGDPRPVKPIANDYIES